MKYSDLIAEWLRDLGYTHCFFVAGGNIMHLLDSVRSRMTCVPVVHEVAAGIAVEAFNEARRDSQGRAFAMVTAGPGLTNIVTALGGAWLESRELLVLGGQVKTADLARGEVRQRGIQEVDGVAIVRPIAKIAERIERPVSRAAFGDYVRAGQTPRKGPVFLEFPLDVQGMPVSRDDFEDEAAEEGAEFRFLQEAGRAAGPAVAAAIAGARRPVILIGGGIDRATAARFADRLANLPVALMTTWNGADRADVRWPNYFGRTNTWGMRYANVLIQQADLVVALGTRLGLQQTGFNWQQFVPAGRVIQVDVDAAELKKGHPRVDVPIHADANALLEAILHGDLGEHEEWLGFCRDVKAALPLNEASNVTAPGFVDPLAFALQLSELAGAEDVIVPCSSGGTYTTMMQAFGQRLGQVFISDKGAASMGYGLSTAIGAAIARPKSRTILTEGDGGFIQNLQELATVAVNELNLKIFVYANEGYASIRMTQRNYFGGAYLGCDTKTGLGFPDWPALFAAFGIPSMELSADGLSTPRARDAFDAKGPYAFVVPIDPEQTYFPKISSRVTASGSMESAPLHLMSPDLPPDVSARVMRYLETAKAR